MRREGVLGRRRVPLRARLPGIRTQWRTHPPSKTHTLSHSLYALCFLTPGTHSFIVNYNTINQDLEWSRVDSYLDAGKKVDLVIEFTENYPCLKDVANGKYDGYLWDFGKAAAKDGRQIYVRPLHEMNAGAQSRAAAGDVGVKCARVQRGVDAHGARAASAAAVATWRHASAAPTLTVECTQGAGGPLRAHAALPVRHRADEREQRASNLLCAPAH
jgi:hypothetical protein